MIFDSIFLDVTKSEPKCQKCDEGVAFLKAAKALYGLSEISYLALNVPLPRQSNRFLHCTYSESGIRQKSSALALGVERLKDLALLDPSPLEWGKNERLRIELQLRTEASDCVAAERQAVSFPLPTLYGETAVLALVFAREPADVVRKIYAAIAECRILANYFHSHILRLNGSDTSESMLISARELDCLKWTAAGKTAWEASKILGISERTVRFHLNAAREKLNCATTTHAVAKAVASQLITI